MMVDLSKSKSYNNYFTAYLKAHGIKDGDEVMFHEYSRWITGKHDEFRQMKGCPYCNGYPPDVQEEFNAFILASCRYCGNRESLSKWETVNDFVCKRCMDKMKNTMLCPSTS